MMHTAGIQHERRLLPTRPQMRLSDPGGSDEQHTRRSFEASAGRELLDQLAIDTGSAAS